MMKLIVAIILTGLIIVVVRKFTVKPDLNNSENRLSLFRRRKKKHEQE